MTSTSDAQQFAELAGENLLHISAEHAAEIESFGSAVKAAYSTIRNINTTGFEPAAIFVPTPSGARTGQAGQSFD
jgi:hypothetical protein